MKFLNWKFANTTFIGFLRKSFYTYVVENTKVLFGNIRKMYFNQKVSSITNIFSVS